jgi:hypothetical protein
MPWKYGLVVFLAAMIIANAIIANAILWQQG